MCFSHSQFVKTLILERHVKQILNFSTKSKAENLSEKADNCLDVYESRNF